MLALMTEDDAAREWFGSLAADQKIALLGFVREWHATPPPQCKMVSDIAMDYMEMECGCPSRMWWYCLEEEL